MDTLFVYAGQRFGWDTEKALANLKKHGIRFEQACEVFADPFFRLVDATSNDEAREAVIGMTEQSTLLFVVHVVVERGGVIRIISARKATRAERRFYEDNG
jgi:uncharacterized protein